jgi:hypothetical protein
MSRVDAGHWRSNGRSKWKGNFQEAMNKKTQTRLRSRTITAMAMLASNEARIWSNVNVVT